ncbi:sulfotransferase [Acetobacteraceae bacterium KSS8]|uniref:Sulfotransferase n=1 Tax=Endosaccharibacter trunci TaxID=2812733 RepID=A0ABT1W732_9PROT|nr:sulfotransferase [Acetobacteraceae bacterium KSS8]
MQSGVTDKLAAMTDTSTPPSWRAHMAILHELDRKQLFFVDGQPRSGTTWLQQLLNAHPEISCQGEAQFRDHLAVPIDTAMRQRHAALHERNTSIFAHTGGYPLPVADDTQFLLGTAMLQAFARQVAGRAVKAVGEKTPGNLFFFPQLSSLFPEAKLISIARDPRDVISSAWHRFQKRPGSTEADLASFVHRVLPMADRWTRAMLDAPALHGDRFVLITFEALLRDPVSVLCGLFRFLGVSGDEALAEAALAAADFRSQTGRAPGEALDGAFHRRGIAGDWRDTLPPALNELVLDRLGWSFPRFGWRP